MVKKIALLAVILVPAFAASASAATLEPGLFIRPCPELGGDGCGPLPTPIHPLPITLDSEVPAGVYFLDSGTMDISLTVTSTGATISEADPNEPNGGATNINLPELLMSSEGDFSAQGTLYPACDDGICPEFIEVIEVSGVYQAGENGAAASIELTFQGETYDLTLSTPIALPLPLPLPLPTPTPIGPEPIIPRPVPPIHALPIILHRL